MAVTVVYLLGVDRRFSVMSDPVFLTSIQVKLVVFREYIQSLGLSLIFLKLLFLRKLIVCENIFLRK